ncbi:MAG TPA: class I SAM-dependent methyltransferase [Prolixibacteraceae bacterium]|nr:class I SAM-dependent methyltransferase [Prolixibacteraceae bacterium]
MTNSSTMQYDPIKHTLGVFFNKTVFLRKLFYRLLNLLLLRSWHIHKELRRWIRPANPIILDAGSGFGQYTFTVARMFPDALIKGVDVKEEQILDCNQFFLKLKLNDRVIFEKADLTKYVEEDQFDLILSVDVMEHIDDDRKVFQNFYRSLRTHGMLLISTPSDQGGSDTQEHGSNEVTGFIEEHVRDGYNFVEIKEKLREAGFSEIFARYQYGWPGKISWKLSMKFPILLLGISKWFLILLPFYYLIVYPVAALLNWIDLVTEHKKGTGLIVSAYK